MANTLFVSLLANNMLPGLQKQDKLQPSCDRSFLHSGVSRIHGSDFQLMIGMTNILFFRVILVYTPPWSVIPIKNISKKIYGAMTFEYTFLKIF